MIYHIIPYYTPVLSVRGYKNLDFFRKDSYAAKSQDILHQRYARLFLAH